MKSGPFRRVSRLGIRRFLLRDRIVMASAGADPPFKGGETWRNIRRGKSPLRILQFFNRPPFSRFARGGNGTDQRPGRYKGRCARMSNVVSQFTPRDAELLVIMSNGVGWSPRRFSGGDSRYRGIAVLAVAISLGAGLPSEASAQNAAGAAGPRPLARYFPSQDLVAYIEIDGLDGHRGAWQKTAAYRVLNETTTGEMYRAALSRIFAALLARAS